MKKLFLLSLLMLVAVNAPAFGMFKRSLPQAVAASRQFALMTSKASSFASARAMAPLAATSSLGVMKFFKRDNSVLTEDKDFKDFFNALAKELNLNEACNKKYKEIAERDDYAAVRNVYNTARCFLSREVMRQDGPKYFAPQFDRVFKDIEKAESNLVDMDAQIIEYMFEFENPLERLPLDLQECFKKGSEATKKEMRKYIEQGMREQLSKIGKTQKEVMFVKVKEKLEKLGRRQYSTVARTMEPMSFIGSAWQTLRSWFRS